MTTSTTLVGSSSTSTSASSRPASPSLSSIPSSSPAPSLLDDQDEDVRIAVRALGNMRNRKTSRYTSTDSPSSPTSPLSSPQLPPQQQQQGQGQFVSRVSQLPLVGSAFRAYDYGKNSSRVVKYGAQMVESSLQAVSRPLIDRLPVNVERLDEFACSQLDRLDKYRRPSTSQPQDTTTDATEEEEEEEGERGRGSKSFDGARSKSKSSSTSTSTSRASERTQPRGTDEGAVVQRSRWQAVLLEAGGLGAALSEESMRRLKYCLQWLQYATAHIDAQILILRDFIASLQPLPSSSPSSSRPPISEEHLRKLTAVRRDIVHTIRQVVDVVSKYAGGALPEPARGRVRGFILKLPQRWASASRAAGVTVPLVERERERGGESETVAAAALGGSGTRRVTRRNRERGTGADGGRSGASSRATSPSSPRLARVSMTPAGGRGLMPPPSTPSEEEAQVTHGAAALAAQRILTLATESLDMMRGVTGVMRESLERADAWVGRLRTVGLSSASVPTTVPETEMDTDTDNPLFRTHSRTASEDLPPALFFSSSASSTTSSLPSTPFPVYEGASVPGSPRLGGVGAVPGSPVAGFGKMSIASRYSTPKMGTALLPGEAQVKQEERGMDVDL